jgi:non-ribosomal peptide synthetase component F
LARWCVEEDSAALANYPATELPFISLPQHQAYLIYTSGSTGKPKGVVVSHGEIAMHCQRSDRAFGMRPDDCELHFYSINFDAATERLLVPLLSGAQVVLRAQGQWDAEEICGLIRTHRINVLGFTPSYGSQLAQFLATQNDTLPVRMIITGGEALTGEHLTRIRAAFKPSLFFNAYGPTETVVMPLASLAPEVLEEGAGSVPIGSVIGARVAYILDADLALVPQGATGELFVGGAGLAQAYHDRAGITAERFVADPFAADGGRMYRTGDLVRQRADGLVEYLGTDRPSSENSWFPHRTRRNRNPSARTPVGARSRGAGARCTERQATGWLSGERRRRVWRGCNRLHCAKYSRRI